MRVCSIS